MANSSEALFQTRDPHKLVWHDLQQGLLKWNIWFSLAYQDIKLRYRRSVLGPLWITLSMAITAYSMGFLYGHLFHSNIGTYFPFLVSGMLVWALISTTITDLIDTFSASENMLKQFKLPFSLHVHRVITRNMITFFHNLLVMFPVYVIFHDQIHFSSHFLFLIPALIIFYFNGVTWGLILAMIGARYRDISQIIKSLIQVVFFVTPIMWRPDAVPASKQIFVTLNPFYAYVQLIRAPLLGTLPSNTELLMIFGLTSLSVFICLRMFAKYRARIIYWI